MKRILHVSRNELYSLFFSPIAWVIMVAFMIFASTKYIYATDFLVGVFQRGGPGLHNTNNLSTNITVNPMVGYFFAIVQQMYIFIPLLTMGVISRETSSGTIKLLHSSPIRIVEIVLGKFFAVLLFILCLLGIVGITVAAVGLSVTHPDYGQIFASMLGLFLVFASYAAIGLFISSLTSYQIVAAVGTLAVLALLSNIGEIGQEIDGVREITFYLNLPWKSYNIVRGLYNVRDIMYFLIVIFLFISCTIIKLKSATESVSRGQKVLRYILVAIIAISVGFVTNLRTVNIYGDTTRDQLYTISPQTQAMLAKLNDGELEITGYGNLLRLDYLFRFSPSKQSSIITNLWEPYIRFKNDIKIDFKYYYGTDTSSYFYKKNPGKTIKQIAEKEANSYRISLDRFLGPGEAKKLVDIEGEEYRCFFQLKYKGRSAILRVYDDNKYWPEEDQIAAALNRLVNTPPKVGFLTDEIERQPYSERKRDYRSLASKKGFRHSLLNMGFDFDTISLRREQIPKDLGLLVVADPRIPFSTENLQKINQYLDYGGNMLLASEPDRSDVVKPVLDRLGLSLRKGILLQSSEKYPANAVFSEMTNATVRFSPQSTRFIEDELTYYGDSTFRVLTEGVSAIDFQEKNGFKITPLLTTNSEQSWNRTAPISEDSLQVKVSKLPNDEEGKFVTAVKLNRTVKNKEQRVIFVADADFPSENLSKGWDPKRYNPDFNAWCYSWFSYGKFPANTLRPRTIDKSFDITVNAIPKQKIILYWIIPAILGIIGSILLIRRKRK